jgi:4-hydroxy-3-polyprenylbenzoate decarboxylase
VAAAAPLVVGITGASGAPYAVRLLEVLLEAGRDVHLSISPSGQAVIATELGRTIRSEEHTSELQSLRL